MTGFRQGLKNDGPSSSDGGYPSFGQSRTSFGSTDALMQIFRLVCGVAILWSELFIKGILYMSRAISFELTLKRF